MADRQAYILPQTLPLGWANWFCITGLSINAETAFRLGIVQGVYPLSNLIEEATNLAEIINTNGPEIAQLTKAFINDSLDMPLSSARKMELLYYQQ